MRVKSLQISNILCFKYYGNVDGAPKIEFNKDFNFIIGENGAGKSTAMEVLSFIFKRVLLKQFTINMEAYGQKDKLTQRDMKRFISPTNDHSISSFRLDHNWATEDAPQKIKLTIEIDDIDTNNILHLEYNKDKLTQIANLYSEQAALNFSYSEKTYTLEITLQKANNNFSLSVLPNSNDGAFLYLTNYVFYNHLIKIHNLENPDYPIEPLLESFTSIGGYRNYHSFNSTMSLSSSSALAQNETIMRQEQNKSVNASEQAEPSIFRMVGLQVAERHKQLIQTRLTNTQAEKKANELPVLLNINNKLSLINLKCKVRPTNLDKWEYSFEFFDLKRDRTINNINSLSSGQKAITHLIFEAYGRGNLKGGLVIIDEPEIHLHHQLQNEYLRIIQRINREQKCQYILITHSESFINSDTIDKTLRFALDNNSSIVISPKLTTSQKDLIKILDITKSTYAFFAKKIVLVEGETDYYFFKTVLQQLHPELNQEISVLNVGGKGNFRKWQNLFEKFGLRVSIVGDFDNVFSLKVDVNTLIPKDKKISIEEKLKKKKLNKLNKQQKNESLDNFNNIIQDNNLISHQTRSKWNTLLDKIAKLKPLLDKFRTIKKISNKEITSATKKEHQDINTSIENLYKKGIYILKRGAIEDYTETTKDLGKMTEFCHNHLNSWIKKRNIKTTEIKQILRYIVES